MQRLSLFSICILLLPACANTQSIPTLSPKQIALATLTPNISPTASPSPPATLTLTPVPRNSFRVMSYNLLYGAGVDRLWDAALPIEFAGRNRLPEILSIVKKIDPHILAVQEANSWDKGTPAALQLAAQELGMNFYFARAPSGFHLGLLSKFEIIAADNLSSEIGKQGVIRATLLMPDKEPLNVFAVHLEPNSTEIRMCEVNALIQLMQPHTARRTLLIGDMNFRPNSPESARLQQAGWKSVAVEPSTGIDQIWIYPSIAWDTTPLPKLVVLPGISDHYPIAAELNLYSTITDTLARATPPTRTLPALHTPIPLPLILSDTLRAPQVLRRENFSDPCAITKWNSRWVTEKISNDKLEIEGEDRWLAFASRYKEFAPGQAVLARFRFAPGSEFEMYFETGNLYSDIYRRYGINVRDRALQSITWENRTRRGENFNDDTRLNTASSYYLLLGVSKAGEPLVQVWDVEDASRVFRNRQRVNGQEVPQFWVFQVAANRGKVWIEGMTEISFEDFK